MLAVFSPIANGLDSSAPQRFGLSCGTRPLRVGVLPRLIAALVTGGGPSG